ncbi:MAG: SDR family oxidoreductase [Deltaproteobacteria bacterium]|nr:SDR family oxidoreductase [Deltaproteobacteria bacterium]
MGRQVCFELARQGASVAFTYFRNEEAAKMLRVEIEAVAARRLDLADSAAIGRELKAMADELGGVDVLVHAASVGSTCDPAKFDQIEDVTPQGWERMMAVNITSPFLACQTLTNRFEDEGGNVVFLGSIDGVKSVPAPVPYATSKGALGAMVKSLAKALGQRRIRVNLVAAGVLEAGASRTLPVALRAEYLKHCGLQRVGRVDELANVVSFFALSNTYVTGQTIIVDGGL